MAVTCRATGFYRLGVENYEFELLEDLGKNSCRAIPETRCFL